MKTLLTLALALAVTSAFAEDKKGDKKDSKFDAKKLEGTWTYASGMKAGEKSSEEGLKGTVTITKDTLTLEGGGAKFVMGYKLDTTKTPVAIDMVVKEGPAPEGSKASGIISVDGDEVKLCYVPEMGQEVKRPGKFESTKDNGAFCFTLKRKK